MANALTCKALYEELETMKENGIDLEQVKIALGNDTELNGVHSAFFMETFNMANMRSDNTTFMYRMLNESNGCGTDMKNKVKGFVFLIS